MENLNFRKYLLVEAVYLNSSRVEERLYQPSVGGAEALVHVGHALTQRLTQSFVLELDQINVVGFKST